MPDSNSSLDPEFAIILCHEFEAQWSADEETDLRSFLKRVEKAQRGEVFMMLMEIEIERRNTAGQEVDPEDYRKYGDGAYRLVKKLLDRGLQSLQTEVYDPPKPSRLAIHIRSDQIGPYKLLEQIGAGGMGNVWMAEQQHPVRRKVALKLIKPELGSSELIARFDAERQALAMMDHPNIAKILDAGTTEEGSPYFAMELVEGVPISDFCDRNQLSIEKRLSLLISVCKAVQHAHQKGIIHRDLKPSNILVQIKDGKPIAKVIDFGLAKALDQSNKLTDKTLYTGFGNVLGTVQYMSPEQAALDAMGIDARSDIYSLGVILHELLVGTTPIDRETVKENPLLKVLELIREKDPPRPSDKLKKTSEELAAKISSNRRIHPDELRQMLRSDLDWVVMKALDKDPNCRYESAIQLGRELNRYLTGQPIEARPPSIWYRIGKYLKRNKVTVTSVTAASALIIFFLAITFFLVNRANQFRFAANDLEKQLKNIDKGEGTQSGVATPHQSPTLRQTTEVVTNSIGMKFKPLAGGTFTFGEYEEARQVTLTQPFEMGIYEVTQEQYQNVMGTNPSRYKASQNPVETVKWEDAVEFCRKLSELPAEKAAGRVYRLPTEAEWEYACRAGTKTRFSFGNDESVFGEYAWYSKNSSRKPHSVGQKTPNKWGLYDMHGNVWEWCQDFHSESTTEPTTDPLGPISGSKRVYRGGGWTAAAYRCNSSYRFSIEPSYKHSTLGFRVVCVSLQNFNTIVQTAKVETNSIGMQFKPLTAGTFKMGKANEATIVTIAKPFKIGVHEVTQEQYERVMGRNPSGFKGAQNPVENLSWNDAVEFCRKLSELPEEKAAGNVYRLPTEMEWEYACRAGTTTKFYFGDDESLLDAYEWYGKNSNKKTHPVGQKKSNGWGLYDILGNVHEWCQDSNGFLRVGRGGCWYAGPDVCQSTYRGYSKPSFRRNNLGLRVVKVEKESPSFSFNRTSKVNTNSIGMKFKPLTGGTFKREDSRLVTLTQPFEIGVFEVTQEQYEKVMGKNPSEFKGTQNPVEQVSWSDAVEFCRRLSELPTEKAAGHVYRLPTEFEWEYACRAGTTTRYSFGNNGTLLPEFAWYRENSGAKTHPVGQKKPNNWGLYDMHGNVWEWCQNYYYKLSNEPLVDPTGPRTGSKRLTRGGGWNSTPFFSRMNRNPASPIGSSNSTGFRVVRVPRQNPKPPAQTAKVESNSIGMKFKPLTGGTFTMGEGKTARHVTLTKSFQMGVYEVTQEQYQKVMGKNPSEFKGPQNPVEQVSWNDAVEFCRKLSELPEEKTAGHVYRLPTDAEWEYACRAGTKTEFFFGEGETRLGEFTWFENNSDQKSHPVGQKKPNQWALYDMNGNVWEWCQDHHGTHTSNAPVTDPTGPNLGLHRVIRGGGYRGPFTHCRSVSRYNNVTSHVDNDIGFRVVRVPKPVSVTTAQTAKVETNSIGMKFKPLNGGTFMMGESDSSKRVTLTKSFELGIHEVTQAQYEKVMGVNPSTFKGLLNPVDSVSGEDAINFCRQLSELPAEKTAGHVYRLPTEAEWEYACRAGTTTRFFYGDNKSMLRKYDWYNRNSINKSHPVGQLNPNRWGFYDMYGNVGEWCLDFHGPISSEDETDPTGPQNGSRRVSRGGSYQITDIVTRSSYRSSYKLLYRASYLGFRVVREKSKGSQAKD